MVFLEPIVDSTGCCQMRTGNDCSRAPAVSSLCQGWDGGELGGPSGGGTSPLQKGNAQNSELPMCVALDHVEGDPGLFQRSTCLSSC